MLSVHGLVCRVYEPQNPKTQNVSQQEELKLINLIKKNKQASSPAHEKRQPKL